MQTEAEVLATDMTPRELFQELDSSRAVFCCRIKWYGRIVPVVDCSAIIVDDTFRGTIPNGTQQVFYREAIVKGSIKS